MSLSDDLTAIEDNDLIEANVININTVANIEFSGTAKKTTIAVNTNDKEGDINLMLNNVTLTSKNTLPAIFAYNKDTSYDAAKVTIYSMAGTTNNVTGGRLKKVSLMDKDNLDQYASYSSNYTNSDLSAYYGVYSASEIENILFATETADSEGISEGDPLYYYKFAGAISSDIALYFAGSGSLSITSTKNEGIETKGDIYFEGGEGDYTITAYDDCINASSNGSLISISVNSLVCDCAIEYEINDNGETVADSETTELAADENELMESTDETTSETSKEATERTLVDSSELAADTDDVETSDNAQIITYIVIIAFSLVLIISMFSINVLFKKLDKE